jgi:rhamnose transport system ATP-binding protein
MPPPLLRLQNIRKSFGAVQALRGVSFELQSGEVHAVVGENGAGKSTLVKIISGAEGFESGSLEIHGQLLERLTPASARQLGIACLYQQPALFPDLTVAENIALRLEPTSSFRRIDWSARRIRAAELLKRVGGAISPEAEVRGLSMPEQQLVEIACAIGSGARIVLMDEPTASLTQKEQHLLFCVIQELSRGGVGIVYISHRLEEVFALANRVTVLRDGETVASGPADAFDEASLINSMVGREISQLYPRAEGEPGYTACSLQGVGCSFSGVHDVCLDWRKGEVLGIAGLVGAGRTELARILFGITPADAGSITLNGAPVQIRTPQEALSYGIAYVPEDRRHQGVIPELSIEQNVTLAIHRRLFPHAWLNPKAERELTLKMIRELGIKTRGPEAPVRSLSGGNQQKVSLARWLAAEPKFLILDEPTQGVDIGAKAEIHRIIRALAKQGLAVLLISSDLPEVIGMSDRIAVMRGGTVVAIFPRGSTPHEIMGAAFGRKGKTV